MDAREQPFVKNHEFQFTFSHKGFNFLSYFQSNNLVLIKA